MPYVVRRAEDRGSIDAGWLKSHYSFSFADYDDPAHRHFHALRVMNDDFIAAHSGFPTHSHRDMEIITYVISGTLSHKDTSGGQGTLSRGDVQTMSAGTGISHSEMNGGDETVHLLQIWLIPEVRGLKPRYAQASIPDELKRNQLRLLVAPAAASVGESAAPAALTIHQDVFVYASILDEGVSLEPKLSAHRAAWIQVISGSLQIGGVTLNAGDGCAIENETHLTLQALTPCEFLFFDLNHF